MILPRVQKNAAPVTGRKLLEVIVTSQEEAIIAELHGADRLEVVRSPEKGGLTPEIGVLRAIIETVSVPVRAMLRERDAMSIEGGEELRRLQKLAQAFSSLPIDGLVLGFVRDSEIDTDSLREVLSAAPHCRCTFHRAFEGVRSPRNSFQILKQFRQVDRVLVRFRDGTGGVPIDDLVQWQKWAAPEVQLVVGLGLDKENAFRIQQQVGLNEVHAGRLVREPQTAWGRLSRRKFLELKSVLG